MTLSELLDPQLIALVCASIILLWIFRVFSPVVLRGAPSRQSRLSLMLVGTTIVVYYVVYSALGMGAYRLGWIPDADNRAVVPVRSAPAETIPTTSTASGPDSRPQTVPAAQSSAEPTAQQIVAANLIEGVAELFTVALVLAIFGRLFQEGYRGWGTHIRQIPRGVGIGFITFEIVYPLLMAVLVGMVWFYTRFQHQMSEHTTFEALDQGVSRHQEWILFGMATLVAPLAEEIFFRGLLQTSLIQFGWGLVVPQLMPPQSIPKVYRPGVVQRWVAIVITSLLFAKMHSADHGPVLFLLSVALGYIYERTGILWAPVTLHAVFNAAQVGQYLLERGA